MIKTGKELASACEDVAKNYKTLYVLGCFGAPLTASNKKRYTTNYNYNAQADRSAMIISASADTFGFDCVCLIKALLWGWNGNTGDTYGGAKYADNGVPDIGADTMITRCHDVSTDFSKIEIGEAVWMKGHIGVYIGDGKAVECTPKWKNGVQITACNRSIAGYNRRNWTSHGKLPYVEYSAQAGEQKTIDQVAREVIAGKWYNGEDRRQLLIDAGYDYNAVQQRVNELISGTGTEETKTVDQVAREVIAGKWGNGTTRKQKITAAGYDYNAVQQRVNDLIK